MASIVIHAKSEPVTMRRPGPIVVDYSCTCVECDKPVRAVEGEMQIDDLHQIRRGARPRYAQHAGCAGKRS